MMKWTWRREVRPLEPRRIINPALLVLETAKQILEEIFHALPYEIEDMIQRRLGEKIWSKEARTEEEGL